MIFEPQCTSQEDVLKHAERVRKMCSGTAVFPPDCIRVPGGLFAGIFDKEPKDYEFAVSIVEGKPVWRGDMLHFKSGGMLHVATHEAFPPVANLSWGDRRKDTPEGQMQYLSSPEQIVSHVKLREDAYEKNRKIFPHTDREGFYDGFDCAAAQSAAELSCLQAELALSHAAQAMEELKQVPGCFVRDGTMWLGKPTRSTDRPAYYLPDAPKETTK